jgi:cytoskeletal protein CcmA (bactofilin family)
MTCPSYEIRARYADDALPADAAEDMTRHLATCVACREAVARLEAENQALSRALRSADAQAPIPDFVPRPTIRPVIAWIGWIALAAWAVNTTWIGLVGEITLPDWLGWAAPDLGRLGVQALLSIFVRLIGDGTALFDAIAATSRDLALLFTAAATIGLFLGRYRAGRHTGTALVLCLALVTIAPESRAFEIRHDEDRVTVPAAETIDDTLIVRADRILIEGTVTGDLIAAGEEVTVRGPVGGSLLAMTKKLTIEGDVGGNVYAAAESMEAEGTHLEGNVYVASSNLSLDDDSQIGGNAALAVSDGSVDGEIGRDLWLASHRTSISGGVLGSLRAYAESVELSATARIGGDLYAKVAAEDKLSIADGAEIGGERLVETWPEPKNPYLTIKFYLGILLRIVAALLAGIVLFRLLPSLARLRIEDGMQALAAAGIGAVTLVATPVLAVIAVLTLIGAPLGLTVLFLYFVAIYAAGILTANQISLLLLDGDESNRVVPLLAGLAIVFLLINLPFVGGVFRFVVVSVGLGVLALWVRNLWLARSA